VAIDPSQTYVLLANDGAATQLPGGDAFWSQPGAELDHIGRAWLVSEFECSSDWPNWEMHPHADEFVYLLEGDVLMLLQGEAGLSSIRLSGRAATLVPKGVWHTAKVAAPSRMLFVTLGAGTEHRAVAGNAEPGPGEST
jgi:mannose-6-phosphate isomerase-like protein (cupin superfamily)